VDIGRTFKFNRELISEDTDKSVSVVLSPNRLKVIVQVFIFSSNRWFFW